MRAESRLVGRKESNWDGKMIETDVLLRSA